MYWRKTAKSHEYKDGDLNKNLFPAMTTSRKKVNQILSLENVAGVHITDDIGMRSIKNNYFEELF